MLDNKKVLLILLLAGVLVGCMWLALVDYSTFNIKDWFLGHGQVCSQNCPDCACIPAGKPSTTPVLVRSENDPLITRADLQEYIDHYVHTVSASPEAMHKHDPGQFQVLCQQFLHTLLADELVKKYVHDQEWDQDPDFIKYRAKAHEVLDQQLRTQLVQHRLQEQLAQTLTDEMALAFYQEEQNHLPVFKRDPFIQQPGGATVEVVSPVTQNQADQLIKQARKRGLASAAATLAKKITTYRSVTNRSYQVPDYVRRELALVKQAPAYTHTAVGPDMYAVLYISSCKPTTFKPYDQVKDLVKEFMVRHMVSGEFTQLIQQLKQKYHITLDEQAIQSLVHQTTPLKG